MGIEKLFYVETYTIFGGTCTMETSLKKTYLLSKNWKSSNTTVFFLHKFMHSDPNSWLSHYWTILGYGATISAYESDTLYNRRGYTLCGQFTAYTTLSAEQSTSARVM
jgi:hypothetical protein